MPHSRCTLGWILPAALTVITLPNAVAMPLVEQLYVERAPLAGADLLPGFNSADTVRNNGTRNVATAPNGNFVGAVNTDPFQGNSGFAGTYYLFGATAPSNSPASIRREATLAGFAQETLGSAGIDLAGNITYTATLTNPHAPPHALRQLVVQRHADLRPRGCNSHRPAGGKLLRVRLRSCPDSGWNL